MKKEWLVKTFALSIVVLFIGAGVVSGFNANSAYESKPLSSGNWLYVGGSGEGNYTKIQDAIDNATDGDTVFVYSGTYYEYLRVEKIINLIGENKYTTIIDGDCCHGYCVFLYGDGIKISGFSITNGSKDLTNGDISTGIMAHGNDIVIYDNFISEYYYGIDRAVRYSNNTIANNIFENNIIGLETYLLSNSKIIGNIFRNNNRVGLDLAYAGNHFISLNTFKNNLLAVGTFLCENCSFIKNNFIGNIRDVKSDTLSHKWDGNYWDRQRTLPKIIITKIFGGWIIPPNPMAGFMGIPWFYPWPKFDWHPAKEPYDIEV